jgi:hypothetical protein
MYGIGHPNADTDSDRIADRCAVSLADSQSRADD